MSVDVDKIKQIAHLARIAITDEEVQEMTREFNVILRWLEQLNEVDVSGVEPMTSIVSSGIKMREDEISDGQIAEVIFENAPAAQDNFFVVPKIIE